ncbi:MAG: nuclear transport factor 2 family protein [Gemmatimonadota bacterium]|nr:MAG: nuclear transport factor 2 family protein [Gemmatimonadota bacterium]
MSTRARLITAMIIAGAAAACAAPAEDVSLSQEDRDRITRGIEQGMTEAGVSGAWAELADHFTADAYHMPAGEPSVVGRESIRDYLARNWGVLPVTEMTQAIDKLDGYDGLAYARGTYHITVDDGGSLVIRDRGKFLIIAEKQADGSWQIATSMYSRDTAKPEVE